MTVLLSLLCLLSACGQVERDASAIQYFMLGMQSGADRVAASVYAKDTVHFEPLFDMASPGIVDRFEADYAVIEIDGRLIDVPRTKVAKEVKEGDVVRYQHHRWIRLPKETNERRELIQNLMTKIWGE